jgi:hypothetical protein
MFRVRDWRVPTKLAAVLLIPAAAFLVIGGIQINTSIRDANELDQFAEGITAGRELTTLAHQLQQERDHTAGVLARVAAGGISDPTAIGAELASDHAAVDQALIAFVRASQPLQAQNPAFRMSSAVLAEDFAQLRLVRDGVKARWLRQEAVFAQYSQIMAHIFAVVPARADVGDEASSQNILALLELAEAKELAAQLRGLIFAGTNAGAFRPVDAERLAEIQARQTAAIERFRAHANPGHVALYDRTMRGTAISNLSRLQKTITERARTNALNVPAEEWWRAATSQLDLLRQVERTLLEDVIDGAAQRAAAERRNAFAATSAIVLIMLAAFVLSWLIGRSMARSLRSLRAEALDVAQHRLPDAIDRLRSTPRAEPIVVDVTGRLRSADEIGDVADAFTAVHRSAVSLAVEQVVMRRNVNAMFVNLARRSQTLVERQLQLLDTLEAAETDPDQLSNLFKLDHLATRMRRNDENLLVLAGSEVSRRWAEPVSLPAVVLAAMAEIEQYARIRHDVAGSIHVVGHAVADVVHLLAELLENATTFSPPDTVVTVSGYLEDGIGSGSLGEATIVIEDHGIGMSPTGLTEANERLAGPADIDVSASERMGLVVVGHLAARHHVRVRLRGSTAGVVAYVSLPSSILAPPPEQDELGSYRTPPGRIASVVRPAIGPAGIETPAADEPAEPPTFIPSTWPPVIGTAAAPPGSLATPAFVPASGNAPGLAYVADPVPFGVGTTTPNGASPAEAPESGAPAPAPESGAPAPAPVSGAPAPAPVSGAPASGAPTSGAPTSGAPTSGAPTSGAPTSGAPTSGAPTSEAPTSEAPTSGVPSGAPSSAPVSGIPGSSAPVSGVPASGVPAVDGAATDPAASVPVSANGRTGKRKRSDRPRAERVGPKRAEDILDAATKPASPEAPAAPNAATRWWSREGGPAPARTTPVLPTQRAAMTAGVSAAGLPVRVPMAALPEPDPGATQPLPSNQPLVSSEPDPAQVSDVLTRFYSGVHRAANEDEIPTQPITNRKPNNRDPRSTA